MIYTGDARSVLKDLMFNIQVDCIVTSPPYWDMRNYDNSEQLGREETLDEYITNLFDIFYDAYYCLKAAFIPNSKAAHKHQRKEEYRIADEYYKNKMRFK